MAQGIISKAAAQPAFRKKIFAVSAREILMAKRREKFLAEPVVPKKLPTFAEKMDKFTLDYSAEALEKEIEMIVRKEFEQFQRIDNLEKIIQFKKIKKKQL